MKKSLTDRPTASRFFRFSRGFTLIEASIALFVGGLMLTSTLHVIQLERAQQIVDINVQRIETIKKALAGYASKNKQLPCPAARNLPSTDILYGKSVVGVCNANIVISGTDRSVNPAGGGPVTDRVVRVGAVPVRDLGLPKEYMTDSWGRLFTFAVTAKLATPLAAEAIPPVAPKVRISHPVAILAPRTPPQFNNPQVLVSASTNINALYVILSHGPDMKGTYSAEGAGPTACPMSASSGYDKENCDNSNHYTFAKAPSSTRSGVAQHFDDIVEYATSINEPFAASCADNETLQSSDGINFTCVSHPRPEICAPNQRLTGDGVTFWCQNLPAIDTCLPDERLASADGASFTCKTLPPTPDPPADPPAMQTCASNQMLISNGGGTFACKTMTLTSIEVWADTTLVSGWWDATATCPWGYIVTGGGWNASFIEPLWGRHTGKNGNGWRCKYRAGGGSSMGDCRAICSKIQ